MNKKLAAFLAALTLLFSLAVPVFAAADARVVLGADLNEEQIAAFLAAHPEFKEVGRKESVPFASGHDGAFACALKKG